MLHEIKALFGFTVAARDGEIGKVKDAYFDDERWVVRHVVVDAGGWLSVRDVLISPRSVRGVDWQREAIDVDLTRQQVKESPSIDTDRPVSRQHEIDYHRYFGYPDYWEGGNLWGVTMLPYPWVGAAAAPIVEAQPTPDPAVADELRARTDEEIDHADVHLRSCNEVIGYDILATDGSIGEVDDFVFDDRSFAVANLVVDTRKWLPGKRVLLAPANIDRVSWEERQVYVKTTREAITNAPEYDPTSPPPDADLARGTGAEPTP
jgi:uncharacterized protein YrrD